MMIDSEEEEEQTALVCDNGKFEILFLKYIFLPMFLENFAKKVKMGPYFYDEP